MNAIEHVYYRENGSCSMLLRLPNGKTRVAYGNSRRVNSVLMRYFMHVPCIGYVPRKPRKKAK